ncbi:MAG: hypothetical protein ACKO23_11240 [Gemmataceae bacterium]
MNGLFLAPFSLDVTPPTGHPLCGGWIPSVRFVDDPLQAFGVVLLGSGAPIVLCAVDWCGLRNQAHGDFRKALARSAQTTPERVALHCVHPHDAPFADVRAQEFIEKTPGSSPSLDLRFFSKVVDAAAERIPVALGKTRRFTHIGIGKARVDQVASNRRILGPDGKVKATRTSATRDPAIRAESEGLIDPWLRTVSFWDQDKPLAALHYYATHPMSHYGQGRVSSDFCGLARNQRARESSDTFHAYFTGCAGNITAGKYNDGQPVNRTLLRDRMLEGMRAAWKNTLRHPVTSFDWKSVSVLLSARREASFGEAASKAVLANPKETTARRNNAAFQLAWLDRLQQPIDVGCLKIGPARILHLPGEPFVEYQLKAQELSPDRFVCVAGYGDGGPGYIPTDKAYLEGGYEPTVALAGPCEKQLHKAMLDLLKK